VFRLRAVQSTAWMISAARRSESAAQIVQVDDEVASSSASCSG
jgi:hypothetical protein